MNAEFDPSGPAGEPGARKKSRFELSLVRAVLVDKELAGVADTRTSAQLLALADRFNGLSRQIQLAAEITSRFEAGRKPTDLPTDVTGCE